MPQDAEAFEGKNSDVLANGKCRLQEFEQGRERGYVPFIFDEYQCIEQIENASSSFLRKFSISSMSYGGRCLRVVTSCYVRYMVSFCDMIHRTF